MRAPEQVATEAMPALAPDALEIPREEVWSLIRDAIARDRAERNGLPEGSQTLAPILHPDGSGWMDFDGGVDGTTVVTLRVVEDADLGIRVQVNLWGQAHIEEVE